MGEQAIAEVNKAEAVECLGHLGLPISAYLLLQASFKNSPLMERWSDELAAYKAVLQRYNVDEDKPFLSLKLINITLLEILKNDRVRDDIRVFLQAKGYPTTELKFDEALVLAEGFAFAVTKKDSQMAE